MSYSSSTRTITPAMSSPTATIRPMAMPIRTNSSSSTDSNSSSSSSSSTSRRNVDYSRPPHHLISNSHAHLIEYSSASLRKQKKNSSRPSAYISDEDLFGDEDAYLTEPPPPPRGAEAWLARPLLPPVNAGGMGSNKSRQQRRSSAAKSSSKTGSG